MSNKLFYTIFFIVLIIVIAGLFWLYNATSSEKREVVEKTENADSYQIQGMNIEILQQGSGDEAQKGDSVTVDYVGILQDGTKFDSSIDRGQPFLFTLGTNNVIQGWELGVLGMKEGEKRKLTIPPELAYGDRGAGNMIPPNATLIFEVTLLKIN